VAEAFRSIKTNLGYYYLKYGIEFSISIVFNLLYFVTGVPQIIEIMIDIAVGLLPLLRCVHASDFEVKSLQNF